MTAIDICVWPARHPRAAMLVALLLIALSLVGIRQMHADPSLEKMFSRNDPAASAIVRVLNHFSAAEELLVLATADDPDPAKLFSFAQRLDTAVKSEPDFAGSI